MSLRQKMMPEQHNPSAQLPSTNSIIPTTKPLHHKNWNANYFINNDEWCSWCLYVGNNTKATQPSSLIPINELVENLQANNSIVHAVADKDIGHVTIELERYIPDTFKHMMDKDTYEIVSGEQALADADGLWSVIFNWTCKFRRKSYWSSREVYPKEAWRSQIGSIWLILPTLQVAQNPNQDKTCLF